MWNSFTSGISSGWNSFTSKLTSGWNSLKSGFASGWNDLTSSLSTGFKSVINVIIDRLNQIGNITLPNKIGLIPLPPGIAGAQLKLFNFQKLNKGGIVNGSGPNKDSVPTMLTPGEFVINRAATKQFSPMLSAINSGSMNSARYSLPATEYAPRDFNAPIYTMPDRSVPKSQDVSSVYGESSQASLSQVDNSVYNYNLSVSVEGSSSSADQIANVVIGKLRNIQSQQVRGQVVR
jgi:hypothetical protein